MKAALYYFGTGLTILAASILFDCSRGEKMDRGEVYHRIEEIKKKLAIRDSCIANHLDSVSHRLEATTDTATYDSVIDDLNDALYNVQDGDEIWFELDALQYDLL